MGESKHPLRRAWERFAPLPGGRTLFSIALSRYIPYTGTIRPRVHELGPGLAVVSLTERRRVRNHLRSVHAVALVNIAELAGNLAMVYALPADARFIVTGLDITYDKKARGVITATCRTEPITTNERSEHEAEVVMKDAAGDTVAIARIRSLIGPTKSAEQAS